MSDQTEPPKTRRTVEASGMEVQQIGRKVIITASDDFEAELMAEALSDKQLLVLLIILGAIRQLPNGKSRLHAFKLTESLLAAAVAPTEE